MGNSSILSWMEARRCRAAARMEIHCHWAILFRKGFRRDRVHPRNQNSYCRSHRRNQINLPGLSILESTDQMQDGCTIYLSNCKRFGRKTEQKYRKFLIRQLCIGRKPYVCIFTAGNERWRVPRNVGKSRSCDRHQLSSFAKGYDQAVPRRDYRKIKRRLSCLRF